MKTRSRTVPTRGQVLICPECSAENNHNFVMYYGDACFRCDFDIRTYVRNGLYNADKKGD